MSKDFVEHFVQQLTRSRSHSFSSSHYEAQPHDSRSNEKLQLSLLALSQPLAQPASPETFRDALEALDATSHTTTDSEEQALKIAISERLVVGLYAQALELCMQQAVDVEAEAEWWADIERSPSSIAWYFLQTLPPRVYNLFQAIWQAARSRNEPIGLSTLTPTSLRNLFPSTSVLRPSVLVTSLFPHLHHKSPPNVLLWNSNFNANTPGQVFKRLQTLVFMPFELTRDECRFRRKQLEKIRDQKAESLGRIAHLRGQLFLAFADPQHLDPFLTELDFALWGVTGEDEPRPARSARPGVSPEVVYTLNKTFNSAAALFGEDIQTQHLRRPSRLVLLWPKILFLPPLVFYLARAIYDSKASLMNMLAEAKETPVGFVKSWLVEPTRDILKTVRTGGDDGVLVRKEGVAADLASLERMSLTLARERLNYDADQLATLATKIKLGDLTPILELYEEDIRTPFKSAVTGALVRSAFIQIQKAKVDIDQALAGIDKLLKSQELTFAFVGVAPAFAIVYLLSGSLLQLWDGKRGWGRYGGKHKRAGAWSSMRRIERLLIIQPGSRAQEENSEILKAAEASGSKPIKPLTAGLLLLSAAQLRAYGQAFLPTKSRLREGFLQDVQDLEDPEITREDKIRVVERMWRSWGEVFGWGRIGGEANVKG